MTPILLNSSFGEDEIVTKRVIKSFLFTNEKYHVTNTIRIFS